ncbi:hypothetical protein ACJ2A9_13440 [Anaerobacillus sp. MEB173]|uniref:hypothetical protein n=1 Tax=Anaerobacillus sp. MEB173 TaxID=3383345 RepID=UPI003F912B10
MYPEIKHFNSIKQEYDDKLAVLYKKREQIEQKIARVNIINNERSLTKKIKNINDEILDINKSKNQRLQKLVPYLLAGKQREVAAATKKFTQMSKDIIRFRAEYLLLIQQLYEVQQYAQDIETAFKDSLESIETDPQQIDINIDLLEINLHDPIHPNNPPLGILEKEVQQVYKTGKLPEWLHSYIANLHSNLNENFKPNRNKKNKRLK